MNAGGSVNPFKTAIVLGIAFLPFYVADLPWVALSVERGSLLTKARNVSCSVYLESMKRTDALTTFLSGISLLIVGPVVVILLVQWWMTLLVTLAISGFAAWAVIQHNKRDSIVDKPIDTSNPGLAPDIVETDKRPLAFPYCSRCGARFEAEAASFCSHCGEQRSFRPISGLPNADSIERGQ
jgi:hypothetical protein